MEEHGWRWLNGPGYVILCWVVILCILVTLGGALGLRLMMRSKPELDQTPAWVEVGAGPAAMYRYNVRRTGEAPADASCGPQRQYLRNWQAGPFNHGDYSASKSSPAVDPELGLVYIGTDAAELLALDRQAGHVVWRFRGVQSPKGIHGSPAFDQAHVYVGDYSGRVYAIERSSGRLVWTAHVGSWVGSSVLVVPSLHTLFVGVELPGPAGVLVGLDLHSGATVFRSKPLAHYCHSSPAYDERRELVVMGDNSGLVSAWNVSGASPQTPRLNVPPLWETEFRVPKADVKSTPALMQDSALVTSWDGYVYRLSLEDGAIEWEVPLGGLSMASPAYDRSIDLALVGSHHGYLMALDARSGEVQWTTNLGGVIMSSPIILRNDAAVLVGCSNSYLYLLDLLTGRILQSIPLESALTGSPVAAGHSLYTFDHLGFLYSFSAKF